MYQNSQVTREHIKRVVRKVWTLFLRYEKTKHEIDCQVYLAQRKLAEAAIAAGHPDWKDDYPLP